MREPEDWVPVLSPHRQPREIPKLAELLSAAGVSPDTLAEALDDPDRVFQWRRNPEPPPWPWIDDPIARALVCAELAKQAADEQHRFADLRAAAVAEAVEASTVSSVARQLGVAQQVAHRLHTRGRRDILESFLNWFHGKAGPPRAGDATATTNLSDSLRKDR